MRKNKTFFELKIQPEIINADPEFEVNSQFFVNNIQVCRIKHKALDDSSSIGQECHD